MSGGEAGRAVAVLSPGAERPGPSAGPVTACLLGCARLDPTRPAPSLERVGFPHWRVTRLSLDPQVTRAEPKEVGDSGWWHACFHCPVHAVPCPHAPLLRFLLCEGGNDDRAQAGVVVNSRPDAAGGQYMSPRAVVPPARRLPLPAGTQLLPEFVLKGEHSDE